jgi:hypothetical protein
MNWQWTDCCNNDNTIHVHGIKWNVWYFQDEVYRNTTSSLLPNIINGYNATVFAYGATGNLYNYCQICPSGHLY